MQTAFKKNNFFYLQATAVFYQEKTFLIIGPPGCGKSRLAHDLIQKGGFLINDDLVFLERGKKNLIIHPLTRHQGILYLRGSGFLIVPYTKKNLLVDGIILLKKAPLPKKIPKSCLSKIVILKR